MMSVVSAGPTPPPLDPLSPTMPLRTMGGDGPAAPDRTRRVMWAAVAGAVFAVVLAAVTIMDAGGSAERSGSAAIPASSDTVAAHASEPVVGDAAAPSPSASPSAKPSPRPSPGPGELITRLHTTVLGLVRKGQLAPEAGDELAKRLREAAEKLADGEADKAREELIGFAEKVVKLRKEETLSNAGYDTLAAQLTQLAQVLPSR
jgi:hypothetical protein